jgi:hypothetical protein
MEEQATVLTFSCPQCGLAGALTCAQTGYTGKLLWHESVRCERCGLCQEADGWGFPPDALREAFLKEGGVWVVTLTAVHPKFSIIMLLRKTLGWDLKTAHEVMKQIHDGQPGAVYSGTREECLWIASLLNAIGQPSDVKRASVSTMKDVNLSIHQLCRPQRG